MEPAAVASRVLRLEHAAVASRVLRLEEARLSGAIVILCVAVRKHSVLVIKRPRVRLSVDVERCAHPLRANYIGHVVSIYSLYSLVHFCQGYD